VLSEKSMIRLQDITIRVRDRFLFAGACWEIFDGQNWAVIGPNGAGKTSLVSAIAGEVPVVGGRITRADELQPRGKIGLLSFERHRELIAIEEIREESRFFSGRFDDRLTTRTYLEDICRSDRPHSLEVDRLSTRLGIHGLLDRQVRTLSTGEIRMVLIARELLKAPRLLILDEPFGGLDEGSDLRLAQIINELTQQRVQLILVTHHLDEIGPQFTHVLAVKNGRVFFQGPRRQGLDPERIRQLYAVPSGRTETTAPMGPQKDVIRSPETGPVYLEMKNVCIRYGGRSVLENLNWTVRRNENWQITGPNGAGKTTLLSLVTADHPQAYANEIFLFGSRSGSASACGNCRRWTSWTGLKSRWFHCLLGLGW